VPGDTRGERLRGQEKTPAGRHPRLLCSSSALGTTIRGVGGE
jgi:hypothetical protein